MTITLPLPAKILSPNARSHWRKKSLATRKARKLAKLTTTQELGGKPAPRFTLYTLVFHFPDARRRDDDNAAASCKAYRDGIADALGIDDHNLRLSAAPTVLIDREFPRLEINLLP